MDSDSIYCITFAGFSGHENSIYNIIHLLKRKMYILILVAFYCDYTDPVTRVQILAETDSISHSTNTLGKGMNPFTLPPAKGK